MLVVTLSYAEGASAMPETGGAATFVRRAFSDPARVRRRLGAVPRLPGRHLARRALRAPLPRGGVRLGVHPGRPVGRRVGIGVIAFVAAIRWSRRVRLYPSRRGGLGAGPLAQLLLAVVGLALVFIPDVLRFGTDLGDAPSSGSIALALSLATLAYTGLETSPTSRRGPRAGAHPSAQPVRGNRDRRGGQPRWCPSWGVSAFPAGPDPSAPDGVASGLGVDWLHAPLVGIATGHRRRPAAGRRHGAGGLHRRLNAPSCW